MFPSKTKEIVIKENSYTATYPNNRQFIALFARKSQLTKEQYDNMQYSLDGNARYAALLADAIATFETIMPEKFFQDVNLKSIAEGDMLAGAQLVRVYQDQVVDWFAEWEKAISEVLKPKEETKQPETTNA